MNVPGNFAASGLVVMRTPLLPSETLDAWTRGLRASSADDASLENALAHDRTLLRARLQALLADPEVADAIFLASPDIVESIEAWQREPDSKKGRRTEQALVRYFLRMITRPTPFGLFSGCTPGRVGGHTRLALTERGNYRRHSRLDMDYLHALSEHLARVPEVRDQLRFRPNSTLHEAAGRLRFAESRVAGQRRTYHLVAFDAFDALRDTLRRATGGARLRELADALVASDPNGEITLADAEAFLHDVVDSQLLLPDLAAPVTGDESTAGLLRQLEALPAAAEARVRIAGAARALAGIDASSGASTSQRYRDTARELEPLGVPLDLKRLFQVDLIKPPSEVVLGEPIVAEILRGVGILHRIARQRGEQAFDEFRAAFQERYGFDREIPLLEALDEENGIGYERAVNAAAEASPLLAGLPLRSQTERPRLAWNQSDGALLQLLVRALGEGRMEVELDDDDLKRLKNIDAPPLPDAFHVMATIAAASPQAVERGDYRVLAHFASGPSGARMLGRFCQADAAIREGVAEHLAAEEALRPDAVFAEIVHLPAGRLGNILARPVLRGYEIPFLGRSGAPEDAQIPLSDLLVSVSGNRVRLRSRRLGREVIPCLTSAHNTSGESLGVYRFLAAVSRGLGMPWEWGPFESVPFLPRVVSGKVVLSRARWRITGAMFQPVAATSGAARYRAAQRFREQHRLPRYVVLTDADHELLVDFENVLALDAVIELVRNRSDFVFTELYPAPDQLCATGPEGRFFHELVIPFAKRADAAAAAQTSPVVRKSPAPLVQRSFAPGSEWLFAKLYTGTGTADQVLQEVGRVAADAIAGGAADRWFFIRYSDPRWHLRIRFHGDPQELRETVQPALQAAGGRFLEAGLAWRVQFDTYEREVERYGGPEAIDLAEEIFFRDSVAVLELLDACSGDAGSGMRAPFLAAGIDALFRDFGHDLAARLRLAEVSRDLMGKQFQYEALREPLASRFRRDRVAFQRVLDDPPPALQRRSEAIAGAAAKLIALERRGRLQMPLEAILSSVVHMFVNRLSRSAGPEHELVLYDYLAQSYRSMLARGAKRTEPAKRSESSRVVTEG